MRPSETFEFPPDKQQAYLRARRLEWWTIAFLVSAILLLYLTMGNSQAMRTAWLEDILGLIPPIAFLIGGHYSLRPPSERFPFGMQRVMSGAYLVAATALLAFGLWLTYGSAMSLIRVEHPTIGTIQLFGYTFWLGWLMIPPLVYTAIVPVILGRKKLPLARAIYDKVLYADADMNKADWMTAVAAIAGIIGIGFGLWWADSLAALVISLDILRDGWRNMRHAVSDLLDESPQKVDYSDQDPVVARVEKAVCELPWVREADVRLRVNGHALFGEAFVVARDGTDLPREVEIAVDRIRALDWRLHSLSITPVPRLNGPVR